MGISRLETRETNNVAPFRYRPLRVRAVVIARTKRLISLPSAFSVLIEKLSTRKSIVGRNTRHRTALLLITTGFQSPLVAVRISALPAASPSILVTRRVPTLMARTPQCKRPRGRLQFHSAEPMHGRRSPMHLAHPVARPYPSLREQIAHRDTIAARRRHLYLAGRQDRGCLESGGGWRNMGAISITHRGNAPKGIQP